LKFITAAYFDGRTSRRWPARLGFDSGMVLLSGEFGEQRFPLAQVRIAENMGPTENCLEFANGARCVVAEREAFAAWLAEAGIGDSWVVRLQRRWTWALGSLAGVLLCSLLVYFFVLPMLAAAIAPRIPAALVKQLSTQTLASLDAHFLMPSTLPTARQEALRQRLVGLATSQQLPAYQLHFRSSPMGPNAFALPDGELIVFDQLVELAANDEEVLAVLAHELGHVAYRHGMRQLIQSSVVSFAVGMYLGDISSTVSGLGALILEAKYSRRFEEEADSYAATCMRSAGYGTAPLIGIFERLAKIEADKERAAPGWHLFASHPETAARIARLKAMP